jgi:hypothetical protein
MKVTSVILFLLAVTLKSFSFGGGHDSLLYDGAVNYELPKNTGCTIKLTVFKTVEITTYSLEKSTACGEVFTEKKAVTQMVQTEMDIPVGSEISTGPDGYARIDLEDGSRILLNNNAKIKIVEEFCQDHPVIRLLKGSVWSKIKKLLGGGGYEVNASGVIAGARGTEFEVITDKDKTIIKVYESKVEATPIMNDETNKLVIKAYEKLIEDMQSGKITMEEYIEKTTKMTEIMEGSRKFPSVIVDAGNMVEVTYEVSEIKTIPADDDRWFEDPKFNR